jgi:hypothetical protein
MPKTSLMPETRKLVESQIPTEFIRPEFAVSFVGSKRLMTLADGHYDLYIMDCIVIEEGLGAEAGSAGTSAGQGGSHICEAREGSPSKRLSDGKDTPGD